MKKITLMLVVVTVVAAVFAQEAGTPGGLRGRQFGPMARRNQARNPSAETPAPTGEAATEKTEMKEAPALNWEQAPLDIVLQAYGEQIGKTMLKDPGTPNATISLKSREGQSLTKDEYLEAIEVVLEMNGVHLEPYGDKFIRAIPRAKARKVVGMAVYMSMEDVPETTKDGTVISVRLTFRYIGTEEAQKALEGFKSDSGLLQIFERTNSILVTDTWENIKRMSEVIRSIDIDTPVMENVFVRQIKNASAQEIKTALEAIVQESQKEMEKNKQANNANAQQNRLANPVLSPANRLLNRTNQPQQPTSVSNESLVMSVSDADRGMIRGKVLILADERSNKLIVVTQKANMDFFDKVIEQLDVETTPDTVVKVYRLKYAESEDVSDMINDLIGNASSSKSSSKGNQNQAAKSGSNANIGRNNAAGAKKSVNQRTGEAKAGELSKENTTVLSDKRINGLVVMTNKELVPVLESIIESMDVKLSQVLIETVIIEVTLGEGLKTGVDWVQSGRYQNDGQWTTQTKTGSHGLPIYNYRSGKGTDESPYVYQQFEEGQEPTGDTTWTKIGEALTESIWSAGSLSKSGNKTLYSTGDSAFSQYLGGGANAVNAANVAMGTATNLFGSALNYVFKSDALNLSAIIQATKTDDRAKYLASPVIMTVDNKEATIDATTARQFITGWQAVSGYNGSGMPTPSYTSKDIGLKVKVTPKINPNGTVMLEVEEEYNQVAGKQDMLVPTAGQTYQTKQIDVATTRKMTSDVLLENMQTVVFGGLVETYVSEAETGIPILKDIPYIGKWLFGSVEKQDTRTELLVFMTPYVLNDGESAQAEAIRRKSALSDSRPWEDHGWSKSGLADPVSHKEQLRRLKDEWKKQDEERKTRIAIEDEKVKRVKQLQEMEEEERKFWIEKHLKDLDDDQQEEIERKLEDPESQDELKKLADQVRQRKLREAAEAQKKSEDELKRKDAEGKAAEKAAQEEAK